MRKFNMLGIKIFSLLIGLGMAGQTASAGPPVHAYELDGDFLDALGGPALVSNGGIIGATRYTFGANQGLSLTNGLVDTSDYSIVMVFEYDSLGPGFLKFIDFQQLTQDFGLYVEGDRLNFWTLGFGGPDMITANTDVQVVLTRDGATQTVNAYLNGVLQWSSVDPTGQAVTASNVLTFFEDDFFTGRSEATSGSVDCIRIHDGALSAAEIAVIASQPGCGAPLAPTLSCAGFEPPMADYPVRVRGNRALPLKAHLFDADGLEITDLDLTASPVFQVFFDSGSGGGIDVSGDALPVGLGDDGNQFVYNYGDAKWQYNLKTSNYSAPGTYTVVMVSGDEGEYVIDPTCVTEFVIFEF